MYKVLYRKYRPKLFSEVVDQPQVTVTLKNELKRGRIAHAYLFSGSRGTGKTTCAKILAKAVNCVNPKDGDPCGECEICRGIEDGSIMDVVEIDAASNNGVDSIRSIIEEANFTPSVTKYRVYIIDEVHMLSTSAFNALLKTLEEPPEHVIFILATTEIHKLLPTILSRCQLFSFKRISPEAIAERLTRIAEEEGAVLEQDAALLIARLADGALRDALSLLDQCLGRNLHVTLDVVNEAAGLAGREYLGELSDAIASKDTSKALRTLDLLHRQSKDMSRLCEELAEYFRGLMLIKVMKDPGNMLNVSQAERDEMSLRAKAASLSEVLHALDSFEETLDKMRYSDPRTQLEMAMVRLCNPELDSSTSAILRRVEVLERGLQRDRTADIESKNSLPAVDGEDTVPKEKNTVGKENSSLRETISLEESAEGSPETKRRQQRPQPVDVGELSRGAKLFKDWPEILRIIGENTKSVAMAFSGSSAYVNGDYMLIDAPQLAFELLKRPEQREKMREAVRQVTGRVYKLGPYSKPSDSEDEEDPLEDIAKRAKDAGIDLNIEDGEDKN